MLSQYPILAKINIRKSFDIVFDKEGLRVERKTKSFSFFTFPLFGMEGNDEESERVRREN